MTVLTSTSQDGKTTTIRVKGRFDFSTHQEFRNGYESAPAAAQTFVVDLREATYLDSSALGMLLLLRDHAGGDRAEVKIINCSADVRKILTISNFEQLFTIQ